jgi:hypothetical protein
MTVKLPLGPARHAPARENRRSNPRATRGRASATRLGSAAIGTPNSQCNALATARRGASRTGASANGHRISRGNVGRTRSVDRAQPSRAAAPCRHTCRRRERARGVVSTSMLTTTTTTTTHPPRFLRVARALALAGAAAALPACPSTAPPSDAPTITEIASTGAPCSRADQACTTAETVPGDSCCYCAASPTDAGAASDAADAGEAQDAALPGTWQSRCIGPLPPPSLAA